jgi:hypothetical protein
MLNAIKLASKCRATNQFNPPPLPGQALAVNAQVLGQVDPVSACYLHYRVAMASTERLPMHRVPQEGPPLWEAIIPASGIKAGAKSLCLLLCVQIRFILLIWNVGWYNLTLLACLNVSRT